MSKTHQEYEAEQRVAAHIKSARVLAGVSQQKLASELGVTFQQVQKMESGRNRTSAGRLVMIAKIVGKPVSYFFEDDGNTAIVDPHTLGLIQAYNRLPARLRLHAYTSIKDLADIAAPLPADAPRRGRPRKVAA